MILRAMSTDKFTKKFFELKKLSQTHGLSMKFVTFWLFNKTFDSIRDILFGLRNDIINKGKPPFARKGAENAMVLGIMNDKREFVSPSERYWSFENEL
jgi:hypothetical protein